MTKTTILEKNEVEELIFNIRRKTRIQAFIFGFFFFVSILSKIGGTLFDWIVIETLAFLVFMNIVYCLIVKKLWEDKTVRHVSISYFISQVVELIALLIIFHFLGVVLFWGIVVLMTYAVFCFLVFTRRIYSWLIVLISISGYLILSWLEYSGLLPYIDLYGQKLNFYQNTSFFIATISLMTSLVVSLAFYLDIFLGIWEKNFGTLKFELDRLREAEENLVKAKAGLDDSIQAKEREIKEMAHLLERQSKLKEGESQKIKQLETFHSLAVGRELKIKELKEKIKKLELRLKSKKEK